MTSVLAKSDCSANLPRKITVMQGDACASADPAVEYTTILGSCVATALFDPVAKIGGLNHFLLAEPAGGQSGAEVDEHFGVYLMELLINEMLALGAKKSRLKARLYGGANMHARLKRIGSDNAAFARAFLAREGIALVHQDLEGQNARRINFKPASGQVRCTTTGAAAAPPIAPVTQTQSREARGDVELF